ncbi:ThuA domain-containing protein [Streptomyces sp. NPDC057137]|uniref:ThuA domain-containing protein n=1 Tax=Streptomyces sp. NPDC057137 TaxID=3346030 RepID=UPI00362E1E63
MRTGRPRRALTPFTVVLALLALVLGLGVASPPPADAAPFRVLVFSKVTNFEHESIPAGIEGIKKLGEENGFEVEASDDASVFSDANLGRFQAIVFNNTNSTPESGDLLDAPQRTALQKFIRAGGGWVGLHAASASERDWDWYEGLTGAIFDKHPAIQTGRVKVLDQAHPSTKGLPELWERSEEWYNWRTNPTGKVHTLAQIKVNDGITGLDEGVDHPWSWCQNYDGGRSWFTAGGHDASAFSEENFRKHLLGGIQWAAGNKPGDCSATKTGSFKRTQLATDLSDPYELAVTPDNRVIYIQRTGKLQVLDQSTSETTTALDFEYSLKMTEQSDGLIGLTLDPDFATNNWLYLLHSDKEKKQLNLSRYTLTGNTVDPASEKLLLEIPTDRDEQRANVHMAGSLTFGKDGDLYVATGDNTDPFVSDNFTPIDERAGRHVFDAQRSAGNTNDLRGKVLRITPEDDGTYSVPEGNLFAPGTAKTRPEVYAMGLRNPFRITTDPKDGALLIGDYGPDSRAADPNRGPEGTVEFNRVPKAANLGWPYCIGANTPFNDYDFATKVSGAKFDCAKPVNDSPNNTGLRELPPAASATVPYQYSGSPLFPEVGGGGAPMSGPVYDYDPDNPSPTKFPEYFDSKWFNYELGQNWFKTFSIQRKDQSFSDPRFPPAKAGDIQSINKIFTDMKWNQLFEAQFGPDGSLYVIDFGVGSGAGRTGVNNPGTGIYRVDYIGDGELPTAKITATSDTGPGPRSVKFSSAGSGLSGGKPVTYAWDFDGDGTVDSTKANPTHIYTDNGVFSARLTVTGPDKLSAQAAREITVGNTRPVLTVQRAPDGGMFSLGDTVPFTVKVTDREDGKGAEIDCERVTVEGRLGHAATLHPVQSKQGCVGEFTVPTTDEHANQDLFYRVTASYKDDGGEDPDVPALTGTATSNLKASYREGEFFSETGGENGGVTVGARPEASGGKRVIEIEHGDWVAYDPVNLTGVQSVTVGGSSGGTGGTVEFRNGSPTGPLMGSVTIPHTGAWTNFVSPTTQLRPVGGTVKMYAVFSNPDWKPDGQDVLSIDWLHFNGRGVEKKPGTSVTVSTPKTEGAAPLAAELTGTVKLAEGRTVASYRWDFGDNTKPTGQQGASASHTYARPGAYTAHLTVTDDKGDTTTGAVEITAS